MKKIVAIGGSNSAQSINKQLAAWAAGQVQDAEVKILDLNDYEMPIYSVDREQSQGIPQEALNFKAEINNADGVVLSLAEYNGSFTSAFKNIVDWVSRIERYLWSNKPVFLMATSPGGRGGLGVLTTALNGMPHQGARVAGHFSLPQFYAHFTDSNGITDEALKAKFVEALNSFQKVISEEKVDLAS